MRFLVAGLLLLGQDEELARRCGSEIDWKLSIDDAAAEAKKSDRLILWYVHTVSGSPMDRKKVVDNYMKMGPWMMRDVVELVNRRFVPLRMSGKGALARDCKVAPLEFIEPGLVFLTADLKMVHRVDRVSTFQEDWFVDLLRGVLAKAGAPEPPYEEALKFAKTPVERARILRRMRKPDEAAAALKEATGDDAEFEAGMLALRLGRWADAVDRFAKVDRPDANYLRGAALFMLNRDAEGVEAWKKLAENEKSAWAWKAAAELAGQGPFYRCFEELAWVPTRGDLPTSSTLPRTAKDIELVAKRCVALLLRTQRHDGSWNDSNYEFGGKDSLPNVYMAGTALACLALLAAKDVDAKGVQAALDRAWPYLTDEANMAVDDKDEVIWGYAYRLPALAKWAAADPAKKDACVKKMSDIVRRIEKLQKRGGIWQHEYDAPFTTATVLHCLWEAKQAGAEVPEEVLKKGAEALASCRSAKGVFSYGYPGHGDAVQGGAGRMPLCELALFLCGQSDEAKLRTAVDRSFDYHNLLERIRKYDDHADAYHNGGFFFWYDMAARTEAIRRLKDDREKLLEKQRDLALSITEIDGCFVDSHELGKTYGTAMGLLTLRLCSASK